MKAPDTSMGGDHRGFPSTPGFLKDLAPSWSDALEELSKIYWKPVYLYIRTVWRSSNDDAKDLTQQFFLHLLKHQTVERYRPKRGPFRSYLKVCLKNFLADQHRRRETPNIPLDELEEEAGAPEADKQFERAWIQSVMESALASLRRQLEADGRGIAWELFQAYDLRPPGEEKSTYAELGKPHGMEEAEVRRALAHVRSKLKDHVVTQVRRSVTDPEELCTELGHLGFL